MSKMKYYYNGAWHEKPSVINIISSSGSEGSNPSNKPYTSPYQQEWKNDGKTHFWVQIWDYSKKITLYRNTISDNAVTWDMGDGNTFIMEKNKSGTYDSGRASSYTYASAGIYCVTPTVTQGSTSCWIDTSLRVREDASGNDSAFYTAWNIIQIELGEVPITGLNNSKDICGYGVEYLKFPEGLTQTPETHYMPSLKELIIPESVTKFYNVSWLTGLKKLFMNPITPPTLVNKISNIGAPDWKIYVPKGSLEAYQTATNWSLLADRMEEME